MKSLFKPLRLIPLLHLLAAAHAVSIDAIYFGQTHVLKPDNPYFGLVGEREALIKVHVTDPAAPSSPAVSATLNLNGQSLVVPLNGPATLPVSIPDGLGVVQHSYANTFTAILPAAWVKTGLQVTVNAGAVSSTVTNMKVGAPTKVIMTMFDVQYFADTKGNYPGGTFAELEAKWPVADLEVRRLGHVVFPELVIPPREDVNTKAVRIKSKAEYQAQTGLSFDGEQSAALAWNGALKRAAGRSGRWSLYYLNVYNAFAGGQAGGFAGVGSGTSIGILHHELGHALSLPHWGDSAAYPYKGDMHGIQAPSNYNETHAGPAWAFHLPTRAFIPPTVQSGNVGGKPVGTYKVDPMQGGGEGWQEPAYLMNHFSDYSVNQMRNYLQSHVVVWNPTLNSYAQWSQTTGGYTTTVSNNGVQFPTTRDAQVVSILASVSGSNPGINMVYPPIGPYTSGLIRLFDPTVAADRTAAQSLFSPTNGSDYCVRVVQGGVTKTYMLAASNLSTADPFAESSLITEAVNLPASGGAVTKIELLSTPNAEDVGLPANPTVLYTCAPLMPEPGTFELRPTANSSSAITMTALPAAVAFGSTGGTIEYQFTETSGNPGATSSAWQASRSYTDTGLQAGTTYSYSISIRAGTLATTASAPASATTPAASNVGSIVVNDTQQFALQSGSGYKTVTGLGTFTAAGSDKLVFVVAAENANNDHYAIFGVRYNGVQMIEAVQQTGITADGAVAIYYLDNPGVIGSGISVSGYNPNGGLGTAYALSGTRPGFGAFNSRKGGTVNSVPLTTSAEKSLVIAALGNSGNGNSAGTPTANSPLVQASSGFWGSQWGSHSSGYIQVATPGTVTPTFTTSTGSTYNLNIAAVEFLSEVIPANTWVQTAGNAQSWTTAANWADGVVPNPVAGTTMDFSTVDILANTVLNLGANRSATLWKFGDTSGTQTWTFGAGNTLTLAGTTPGIDVQSGIVTQLDCDLAGIAGLTKSGTGRLVLAGNNTCTGITTISAGTLQIGSDGTAGNLATGNVVNNGALRFDRTGTLDVPNAISGTGSLTIACPVGAGTISLGGTNSFTGAVTITSGALRITNSSALGTGTKSVKINTGTAGNPQLRLDGSSGAIVVPSSISYLTSNESNGAIVNEGGDNTIAGPITLTGGGGGTEIFVNAGTLTLSGPISANTSGRALKLMGAGNGSVTGIVSNSSASTSMGVIKEGAGTWTISGNNTHGGGTNVVAGTLVISHPNALGLGGFGSGNGGTSITAGAALNLNGVQNINEVITVRGTGISNGGALINSSGTTASISSGVVNISLTAGGVHSTVPTITFSGGGGTGAAATATLGLSAASFTINGGTTVYSVAPTVTISGGGGSGATATAVLTGGIVSGIMIVNDGSGYTTAPTIAFSRSGHEFPGILFPGPIRHEAPGHQPVPPDIHERTAAVKPALSFLAAVLLAPLTSLHAAVPPNVIVILVDDMGYGDIAAHGNPVVKTPHLDRLHAESARLTDFHVDPTCSPTRAALMTGRYPHRVKVWHTIAAGNQLRAGELTMADAFRANGYRTAMFGKWHLGSNLPYRPVDRGFDEWLGQGDGGTGTTDDHFLNDRVNDRFIRNGERDQPIAGWAEDVFFDAATGFVRESKKAAKPFFIYLATYSPHAPVTLPDPSGAKDQGGPAFFFKAIERIDARIGTLRAMLAEERLARDTIIIFMTDNGGTSGVKTFNAGMRGQKGAVHDGGHRVPCLIHWPAGGVRQGEDITPLGAHVDMLPTLVDLCGLKLPRPVDFDGRSIRASLLDAKAEAPDRTVFVERQRTYTPEKWRGAVAMTSRWRLVDNKELYDIKVDPGQQRNVIAGHPDVVAKLRKDFDDYWTKVTPGDRDRAEFIVGDPRDPETFLHASDWYLPKSPPWNHAMVAAGPPAAGDWHIRAARSGTYRFEVRRWPREAAAGLAGVPGIQKTVDAWDAGGPKPDLLYGSPRTKFKKLPVAAVRLTVDGKTRTLPAAAHATEVSFDMELGVGRTCVVKADLLDRSGEVIAGGYYTYCRKVER